MKIIKSMAFCLVFSVVSFNAIAGVYISQNSKIVSIANTNGNSESFAIWVSGGTGPCANTLITFTKSAAGSEQVYERAYATALAAFMSQKTVWVHNYDGDSCDSAAFIRVFN